MSLLEVQSLDVRHGLLRAVRDVSFGVDKGEIIAFVGANGAGKTTLFRAIAGAHRPTGGHVLLDGKDITAVPSHERVKRGIALVPEGRHLFTDMTVHENLMLAKASGRKGPWDVDSTMAIFPNLAPRLKQRSGTLSGGEQQAAAIARALITNPEVLLLDEVSLGLSPVAVANVYESLQRVIQSGATILLVEQDLNRALAVAGRVICMRQGQIVTQGRAGDMSRAEIMDAYFGARDTPPREAHA
ncbi:MAG: ABC transporter ATP-binding protein [Rhodanobacteraceae bacterium]